MLVLVVAKKTRDLLSVFAGLELRAGLAIAGAEARFLLADSAAWLKPCPDTKLAQFRAFRKLSGHAQAIALWECSTSESASQMLRSGKNEVMGILIHWVQGPSLTCSRDEGEGHMPTGLPRLLPRVGIDILDRAHDERADGDAGGLGALFQTLVQRFRKLDNGSGWHELIMTQVRIEGASEQVSLAISLPSGAETQDRPHPLSH